MSSGSRHEKGKRSTRPDPLSADIGAFLEKARRDLATATEMAQKGAEYRDVVCFHSHQTAEKALKAALLAAGSPPERTHDLTVLLSALAGVPGSPPNLDSSCQALSDFGVAPRYPGWEEIAGDVDLDEVLGHAREILLSVEDWIAHRR